MNKFMMVPMLAAAAMVISACSTKLDSARMMTPTGATFTQELSKKYLALANEEAAEVHFEAADGFAERSITASKGQNVAPYDPEKFGVAKKYLGALRFARGRLIDVFNAGGAVVLPTDMAEAVTKYDCWVEEQEEALSEEDIARCRDGFFLALKKIEKALQPKPMAKKPVMKMKKPMMAKRPAARAWVIYFASNSSSVGDEGKATVKDIIKFLKKAGKVVVRTTAHTDRSGSAAYNEALSENRNEAVIIEMMRQGVPGNLIRSNAFGEDTPVVNTADGAREALNRRVEISVHPK